LARERILPRRLGSEAARKVVSFRLIEEIVSELRRVTWPSREETMRLTLMVLAVAATVGIFLGLVDIAFSRLFGVILGN
jgi:preprotein translocase SecE subunit